MSVTLSADYAMIPRMPPRTGSLIGRTADLAHLTDAVGLHPAEGSEPGGVVVLSGDAGIGKSRLLAQLRVDAEAAGWSTAVGHCVGQAGSALAYLPFVELIGTLDADRLDLVDHVLATHPSLRHLLPGRGEPSAAASSPPAGSAGSTDPGQVAEAVHALLTACGAAQPTLVVVEDVHWADHSSRDLLTLLLTRGFSTAVGLVVSYRSDDLHRRHPLHETLAVWDRIAGLEHVDLAPLPAPAVHELVSGLVSGLEGAPDDPVTVDEIARRAQGNPFFAEELVASAAAGQSLTGGLSRVLRARVDQLDETTQRVLRVIALKGGQHVGHELLSRVAGVPDEALEAAIAEAVERHVLEASWPPAYTFRHALLGEAVADTLLPGERLRLHRAYAAVLAERPDLAPASELARHAAAVGDLPTAVAASRAAGESAMEMGGPQDALQHFERALGWLDEDDPERDALTLRASAAAMVAGEPVRAIDLLRDRLDHPGRAQDPETRADLLATLVIRARILDLPTDALALTDEAMALIGEVADERRVRVLVARLQALVDIGHYMDAAVVGTEVSMLAERLGLQRAQAEVRTIMARVLEAQEDLDAVEAHLRTVADDLPRDDPLRLRVLHQLASIAHRRGDLPAALAQYDAGAAVARQMHREWAPWGQECRLLGGLTAYELGDWDGATRRLSLSGAPAPQPGRSIFTGALLSVSAGRGEAVEPAVLTELREWWPVDGLCVVLTVMPGIDLLAQAGDLAGALDLAEDAEQALDRAWGDYFAIVRLAALVAGQVASASGHLDPLPRRRAVDVARRLGARALAFARADDADVVCRPAYERSTGDQLEDTSREAWAWLARLEAELARLDHEAGDGASPSAASLAEAWRRSVTAFDRYGHVFEAARSRARLAAALHAAGDEEASRAAAARAREVAVALGAGPLLAELDSLQPAAAAPGTAETPLTPREVEVLGLLSQGLTNGQIGRHLFISTKTVSVHVSNLLAKLGASGRTEAAAIARRRGLVP
ncbi:helix-turn-helix transcriptional regulator [Humibacillus xanthopallidus]|uniref:Regulatory LuxR family protein n=1 Tax=Humibacillus xanthopallidus TaxID=412689 RepID=A0A543I339_9MICO|nr:helix-turn-helix transcriptional regulator [Humibacillus xanthopallidus]TQM64977.1 regulatory LuxR family protein [Humibacillus xanthopallidus]